MNLHFEIKKGSREGTLVFLHGNSSSSKVFNDTFASSIDHTLIRLDFPGHGGSPRDPQTYDIHSLRSIVIDFIKEKAHEPFLLIGNSLGGHLAIEILPELPDCKGLVIFGTPPLKKPINAEEAFLPCEALNTYFKADYSEEELDTTMAVATYGPNGRELLRDDFIQTDPTFRSAFYHGAMVEGHLLDETAIVASDPRPVYVIQGVQDPTVNVNYIRGLKGITKIFEINKCGHYASLEEPYQFNSILKKISSEVFKP